LSGTNALATLKSRSRRGSRLDVFGRLLEALVFLQAAHEFGARIVLDAVPSGLGGPRQQQARFDLGQHRGHEQVLGGEFQTAARAIRHRCSATYWRVISAMGMSRMSRFWRRIRYSKQVERDLRTPRG
jgi:hypothetical protein